MEEILKMIPVVEAYILQRKGVAVKISVQQFQIPDPFLVGKRAEALTKAYEHVLKQQFGVQVNQK